ncbi:hypothetical protein H5410_037838 [Solanum commersonii]|uniref:Uncharacterized protein n=1 Tax=Solanum commersonii TaxID=4109 RepID=A0A9J5YCA6_SOLCO|nr:hypothetical protein H5410_037838 [Solanum commersonii]
MKKKDRFNRLRPAKTMSDRVLPVLSRRLPLTFAILLLAKLKGKKKNLFLLQKSVIEPSNSLQILASEYLL